MLKINAHYMCISHENNYAQRQRKSKRWRTWTRQPFQHTSFRGTDHDAKDREDNREYRYFQEVYHVHSYATTQDFCTVRLQHSTTSTSGPIFPIKCKYIVHNSELFWLVMVFVMYNVVGHVLFLYLWLCKEFSCTVLLVVVSGLIKCSQRIVYIYKRILVVAWRLPKGMKLWVAT